MSIYQRRSSGRKSTPNALSLSSSTSQSMMLQYHSQLMGTLVIACIGRWQCSVASDSLDLCNWQLECSKGSGAATWRRCEHVRCTNTSLAVARGRTAASCAILRAKRSRCDARGRGWRYGCVLRSNSVSCAMQRRILLHLRGGVMQKAGRRTTSQCSML